MGTKATAVQENPIVRIEYSPANAPLILADNATKVLARINGAKPITNSKGLEAVSEIIEEAKITSGEIEVFINSLRDGIQRACERVRELRGYEDFEATLTIRKWSLRQYVNDGIMRLRNSRAKFMSDEEERVRRAQLEEQSRQDKINKEASDKAAAAAKKQGADPATIKEIREAVKSTPAPVVTSKALDAATSTVTYQYSAQILDLKKFLGVCLNNETMLNTLRAAIPDIEKAFRGMAVAQKEAFTYAGITFKKVPVDRAARR